MLTLGTDILIMRLNEYRTLRIMIASFLLWTGDFLSKDEGYTQTKEFSNLCSVIVDAASGIRSTTESYISALSTGTGQQFQNVTALFIRTSMLLFPLYCASRAPCLDDSQRRWFTESLCLLGSLASTPKAFALVRQTRCPLTLLPYFAMS